MTTMEWVCIIVIFAQATYIGILQNRFRLMKQAMNLITKTLTDFAESLKKGSNDE